jgi:hypothetical protein
VTASTSFATLGYESPSNISSGSLTGTGFSVSYDAATKNYVMDVPASQPGAFKYDQQSDFYWFGHLTDGSGNALQPIDLDVFRTGPQNFGLTYTSYGRYNYGGGTRVGEFAFGMATPQSAVPVTGSATYTALVDGHTNAAATDIGGTATLQFNFGAGTLAGHLDPHIFDPLDGSIPLGRYSFVNPVYATGSTSFSGQLSTPGVTGLGAFEGQFTGPAAQELMARFHAPFLDPFSNTQGEMFGVWVGKH